MYAVMHVTGFLRPCPPAGFNAESLESLDDISLSINQGGSFDGCCLVGVARLQVIFNNMINKNVSLYIL